MAGSKYEGGSNNNVLSSSVLNRPVPLPGSESPGRVMLLHASGHIGNTVGLTSLPLVGDGKQIIDCTAKGEQEVAKCCALEFDLAERSNGLQPAEAFFDLFALLLTDLASLVACRASVDGACSVVRVNPGKMRSYYQVPNGSDRVVCVVGFVTPQRYATTLGARRAMAERAFEFLEHRDAGLAFGCSGGLSEGTLSDEAMTVVDQHVTHKGDLRLLARALDTPLEYNIFTVNFVASFLEKDFQQAFDISRSA